MRTPLIAFFNSLKVNLPPTLTVTIPASGETYDDATGDLIEVWSNGSGTVINGSASDTAFARGVGCRFVWETTGITNGRRVRGSTFLVPIVGANFSAAGVLSAGAVTAFSGYASTLVAATQSDFTIWTRPKEGTPGKSSGVTGSSVSERVSTLRSRRV